LSIVGLQVNKQYLLSHSDIGALIYAWLRKEGDAEFSAKKANCTEKRKAAVKASAWQLKSFGHHLKICC